MADWRYSPQSVGSPTAPAHATPKSYVDLRARGVGVNDPLYRWRRAYSKRFSRQVGVLCIGDSVLYGDGGTPGAAPAHGDFNVTLQQQLQALLNQTSPYNRRTTELSITPQSDPTEWGGQFVRTAATYDGLGPNPWYLASGSLTNMERGMGLRVMKMAAGTVLSFTAQSATGFFWWYEDGASNLGMPNVSIYGGDYVTPRTQVHIANYAMVANTGLAQYATTVNGANLPCRGKWTFEFGVASGTPVISGLYVLDNDEFSGVRVFNNCLGATTSGSWADATSVGVSAASAAASMAAVAGIGVLVIYLGTNDYGNNVSPSTYQSNLSTIITNYRAQTGSPPVLLVSHFARYDITTPTYPWSQYQTAMQNVAAATSQCDYLDLSPYFPTSQATDTDDDLVDTTGVHFTQSGQSVAAQLIADKLMASYV